MLALPIAATEVGPAAAVGLTLGLGLLAVISIVAMAEAITRNGTIRYGSAFLGRLVGDLLGPTASFISTLVIAVFTAMATISAMLGLSISLATVTGLPGALWALALLVIVLVRLWRGARSFSVTTVVMLGGTLTALLVAVILLALAYVRPETLEAALGYTPAALPQSLLGVLLMCYFGPLFLTTCARLALPRDPSGRGLILGSGAAIACPSVLFVI